MAHPPHFGLRAQLRNYFGKHATFSVQINIHELANVPLVSGDFACKWRVKGAQPLTQVQSLARRDSASTKSVRSDGTGSVSGSGSGSLKDMVSKKLQKARTGDTDIEVQVQPPSPPPSAKTHGSISTTLSLGESGWSSPSESSDSRPGTVSMLLPDSMSSSQGHSSDTEDGQPRQTHSSVTVTDRFHPHLHSVLGPGRGTTATVAIADHTVRWDELVELAVHMGIIKETKGLMPNELKLMVEHVPQLHEQLVKPRTALGVVRINLAEYVGRGPITRRYLLRDSKTNATLKLTIEVKWLSGEQDYIAPPLQKAQIMEGVAGLMSNDRILPPTGVRTPPRPAASTTTSFSSFVNIGTPTPDLLPAPSNLNVNRGRAASLSRSPTLSHSLSFSRPTTPGPTARTEQIIEALFNPVPTTNPNPSPFAYYAPGRPPIRKSTINVSAVPSDLDSSWSIVKAQQDAQARALLQMPLTEEPVSREPSPVHENPGWWKRIGSATLSKGKRPEQPPPTIRLSSAVV